MKLSEADELRNRQQFDSYCKTVLRGEVIDYRKETAQRASREICFSELSENDRHSLLVTDEYPSETASFDVMGFAVEIHNDLLEEALNVLPPRKRDVILLSYFLDMNDAEISRLLNNDPSTIHYHRTSALNTLAEILKEAVEHEKEKEK